MRIHLTRPLTFALLAATIAGGAWLVQAQLNRLGDVGSSRSAADPEILLAVSRVAASARMAAGRLEQASGSGPGPWERTNRSSREWEELELDWAALSSLAYGWEGSERGNTLEQAGAELDALKSVRAAIETGSPSRTEFEQLWNEIDPRMQLLVSMLQTMLEEESEMEATPARRERIELLVEHRIAIEAESERVRSWLLAGEDAFQDDLENRWFAGGHARPLLNPSQDEQWRVYVSVCEQHRESVEAFGRLATDLSESSDRGRAEIAAISARLQKRLDRLVRLEAAARTGEETRLAETERNLTRLLWAWVTGILILSSVLARQSGGSADTGIPPAAETDPEKSKRSRAA